MEVNARWVMAFRAVAMAESISGGARMLGLTQPTTAAHVEALERALGLQLLIRDHSGVSLTDYGEAVLTHADAIAYHIEAIATEAQTSHGLLGGTVRVAAFAAALGTFVPPAWSRLRAAEGPKTDLDLKTANPVEALSLLQQGRADLAIVYQHEGDASAVSLSGYTSIPLSSYEVRLVLPADHPLAYAPEIRLGDFAGEDFVFGFTPCHNHLLELCHEAGFAPRVRHECDDFTTTQTMVAEGVGVGMLTRCCLDMHANPDTVIRSLPELTRHKVYAVCRPGAERVPAVQATLNALRPPHSDSPSGPAPRQPSRVAPTRHVGPPC